MRSIEWKWIPDLETAILGPYSRPGESIEIVAGAALLERPEPVELRDHIASRLLDQLTRMAGGQSPLAHSASPFFGLAMTERVLLSLLHRAKWTYAEVAKLLHSTPDEIEELAWMTRLELARRSGSRRASQAHPRGSPFRRVDCPEYFPARPWTQRWVEGAYQGTEKLFLQRHLEGCEGCREAALTARKIFFTAESAIPLSADIDSRAALLERAFHKTRYLGHPQEQKLSEAFFDAWVGVIQKPLFWLVAATGILLACLT